MSLIELKNLGKTSVRWLNAVGIHTKEELETAGATMAFHKIRQRGFRVSYALLYGLEGALRNVYWKELPQDIKTQLLTQLQGM